MVYDLRQRDLLSNKELACVTFEQLLLSPAQEKYVKDLGLTTVLPARYGGRRATVSCACCACLPCVWCRGSARSPVQLVGCAAEELSNTCQ